MSKQEIFTIIEKKKEIEDAQLAFAKKMRAKATKNGKITVGYQGGNMEVNAHWFKENDFWWSYLKLSNEQIPRHWNGFGIRSSSEKEPVWNDKRHSHSITCEINPPLSGNRWGVAGAFVKDTDGEIYIAHSGKIGGGRKGMGKSAFIHNFSGTNLWHETSGSRGKKNLVITSNLNDKDLVNNIGFFVNEVFQIKNMIKAGKISKKTKLLSSFKPEFEGRKAYSVKQRIQSGNLHAKVVNNIKKICEKYGLQVINYPVDVLIEGKSKDIIMEVKTSTDTQNRYTAIGQLLYYSLNLGKNANAKLVAMFPAPVNWEFKKVLDKLGIQYLTYGWENNKPKFDSSLTRILRNIS